MNLDFDLTPNGDAALDICFRAEPSEALSKVIIALAQAIEKESIVAVTEMIPAYRCLTICFDPLRLPETTDSKSPIAALAEQLSVLTDNILATPITISGARHLVKIPVCYEHEFAPDMANLCQHTGMTAQEIIERHTAPHYLVHMLGFTPGFLYLGGLDQRLHCPRKERPELRVPAGSVGIGGSQTGIYPQATPGGWQIIGRTPLALFRPQQTFAFIARPLDRIQFVPITAQAFAQQDPLASVEKILLEEKL